MKHTVAIPSYRRPDVLRRALEGLIIQERPVDEVIVVARRDDLETQRVARELEDELPINLQLVDGTGVITPVNLALDTATGDIISFIDDDAIPHRDWARKIINVFETEPDLAGLGGRDHIFQNGEWLEGESKIVGIVHWYGRVEGNHHLGVGPQRNVDVLKGVNMSLRVSSLGNRRIDTRLRGSGAQWHWELKLCLDLRGLGKRLAYDPAIVVDHYPAPRFDEDQRSVFDPYAYENQVFNLTLSLLEYLNPFGRTLLLLYAWSVGIKNNYCGALKTLLYGIRLRRVPWRKGIASARGVYAAWKAYKSNRHDFLYAKVKTERRFVPEEANCSGPAVLMAHPTGNQNLRNALRSLVEHQMLAEFWTTLAWNPEWPWGRLIPRRMRDQLARRTFSEAPKGQIKTAPWREVVRLGMRATPMAETLCSGERAFSIIGIYRHFDRHVARRVSELRPGMVYAYEGGALETFRAARKHGITTVYEQPSGYWHWESKFFAEEAERNPEFASLLPALTESSRHLEWKDEELRLADYVFVPSDHVRQTLREVVGEEKIRVIGYGAPPVRQAKQVSLDPKRPLKVIFAGSLIQRKGIGYLLDAVKMLGTQVELLLVGRRIAPHPTVDEACNRYRWIESLSHAGMLEMMDKSDVLVLPSLTDAFGLVVTEALACGLPVIVTPNTGASEVIHNGREGFVVPICRADAIAERLEMLHRDRDLLAKMSCQAQATAANNSWDNYRANWARLVESLAWH